MQFELQSYLRAYKTYKSNQQSFMQFELQCSVQCPEGGGYCKFTTIAKRLGFYTDSWSLYRIYTLPVPLACI